MLTSVFQTFFYIEYFMDCRGHLQKDNFQINADSSHLQTPYRTQSWIFTISLKQNGLVKFIHKD